MNFHLLTGASTGRNVFNLADWLNWNELAIAPTRANTNRWTAQLLQASGFRSDSLPGETGQLFLMRWTNQIDPQIVKICKRRKNGRKERK